MAAKKKTTKAKRNSAGEQLAALDRDTKLIAKIREGIPLEEACEELDIAYSTARSVFLAYMGFKQEEQQQLAREVREEVLATLRMDQGKMRKLSIASLSALEQIVDEARKGEADFLQVSAFDVGTSVALMKEYRELTKLILGMVDATEEAANAHARRNLSGSGISTVEELRERLAKSPAFAKHLIDGGVLAVLKEEAEKTIDV